MRFIDNGNGTITDNETGLMWEQGPGFGGDWETCKARCESLDLAGYSDWRMPTVKELPTIVDYSIRSPTCDQIFEARSDYYWSSTTLQGNPNNYAWFVNFGNGSVYFDGKDFSYAVRAVRGGLMTRPFDADEEYVLARKRKEG